MRLAFAARVCVSYIIAVFQNLALNRRKPRILAHRMLYKETFLSRFPRFLSTSAVLLAVCALGIAGVAPLAPETALPSVKTIQETLPLPDLPELSEQIVLLQTQEQWNGKGQGLAYFHTEKSRPGDTLATLFARLGIDDEEFDDFIKTDALARKLLQIKPGKPMQAQTDSQGKLQWLNALLDVNDTTFDIIIKREGNRFTATEKPAQLERRVEMRAGEIRSSLFAATDAAQVPESIAAKIIDLFASNIDFASDLRRGDRFHIVYETFWQHGQFVRTGRILAGEFLNNGKTYQSVWFDNPGSNPLSKNAENGGYYSFDGKSLKQSFLKSPLEFSRISSGFAMRLHPISGQWKAHKGVDFAAPSGTPIRAAGAGTVEFIGWQNGYGNVIVLSHAAAYSANYSTVYAHMSGFANHAANRLRKGSKVEQGEVIGYVGSTGWATGPHLHYEFRINNEPRDPLTADIPHAQPLAAAEMQHFRAVASDMAHRLALLNSNNNSKNAQ